MPIENSVLFESIDLIIHKSVTLFYSMLSIFWLLFSALGSLLRSHAALHAENLAFRHQLLVFERSQRGRGGVKWSDGIDRLL